MTAAMHWGDPLISAFVLIAVRAGREKKVLDEIQEVKGIEFVNELYGEWDLIAKIKAEQLEAIDHIISDDIRTNPDVKLTSTMIVAR